jgi:hypothetical protein
VSIGGEPIRPVQHVVNGTHRVAERDLQRQDFSSALRMNR